MLGLNSTGLQEASFQTESQQNGVPPRTQKLGPMKSAIWIGIVGKGIIFQSVELRITLKVFRA